MESPPKVLLISPCFNPNSFWSFGETCKIDGKRFSAPPLGLLTLAALLPSTWDLRLVDANVRPLVDADVAWADLVMTGGMLPQVPDMQAIVERCNSRGTPVCVGGSAATSTPESAAHADFLVLGEAEGVIDEFIAAWDRGERSGRFEAVKFQADVTKSPVPRFDLIDFSHYLQIGVQFSRGCPFTCEFCDIIELYGRVPRTKTNPQMIAELDRLYALGYRGHVDFVDDNLIGNKKALKRFLPELRDWQVAHRYPFEFSTEASINLADDAELLALMREVNFFGVFVGIESSDPDVLVQTQKKQNTRRSLEDSVFKIYSAGIFVLAGFIVGFDSETDSVAQTTIRCIEATSIPICMVGLLTALPNTQLTRRLEREGRLYAGWNEFPADNADQCTAGLNFVTARPRRAVLADYKAVLEAIYTPKAFFARLTRVAQALRCPSHRAAFDRTTIKGDLAALARILLRLIFRRRAMLGPFVKLMYWAARHNPAAIVSILRNVGIYMHVGPFAQHVMRELDRQISITDRGLHPADAPRAEAPLPALLPAA